MRRHLPLIVTAVVLFGFLGVAAKFSFDAWRRTDAVMSVHGWIALALGVFFSLVIGCGLMALMFFSSRRGYDEQVKALEDHREVP